MLTNVGRPLVVVPVFVLVLCALVLVGCEGVEPARPRNLLLISIDTLRPDHLGAYGHPRPTSPVLDRIAAQGALFEDAWSPSPWTLPAHATLLTGVYPSRHGLKAHDRRVRSDVPLLAELLAAHGFETVAFVNSQNLRDRYGFDRGFAHYRYLNEHPPRDGPSDVHAAALRWLASPARKERPFFLFLHFYDVHSDYRSLPRYRAAFAPPGDYRVDGSTDQLQAYRKGELELDASDAARLRDLYDAGIRQMDDGLGRIVDLLEAQGLLDSTLIVITSDHGEEFLEHGGVLHGRTQYPEVARVPLVLRGPGVPAGTRIAARVSLIDVLPTVVSLLGLEPPGEVDGLDLSVLFGPGDERAAAFEGRLLFGEADHGNAANDVKRAVRDGRYSLHLDRSTGARALYDVRRDPGEQTDVSAERPGEEARLGGALEAFMGAEQSGEAIAPLSPEDEAALKSLGYLE